MNVSGRTVQRFRKAVGMSQTDLAQALTERGASFQQQTVLKVEKGSRPLKLDEAALIADILTVPVFDLLIMRSGRARRGGDRAKQGERDLAPTAGSLGRADATARATRRGTAQAEAAQQEASERFEAAAGDGDGTR
jgi:transcriptional regulator with XRE-family HTH domain